MNKWFENEIDYFWYIAIAEVFILVPLCYIRNIKVFSSLHLIGDIAILCVVVALGYDSIYHISNNKDFDFGSLKLINNEWFKLLGLCVTSLEGIGVLLPVKV
jgi:proton-coupled amino acid transporter